jgi:hypothetical protein
MQTLNEKVAAHLVDIARPIQNNPCSEIGLPVLMRPHHVTLLRLRGVTVFDYTESLGMDDELVSPESCYVPV